MEITKQYLEERFIEYNSLYFNGILKKPLFLFKTNKDGVVAKFRYNKEGKKKCSPKIYINKCIAWDEDSLKNVLLHEMVHYYVVFIENYDGLFSHGFRFRRKVREIKKNFGYTINISYKHLKYKGEAK